MEALDKDFVINWELRLRMASLFPGKRAEIEGLSDRAIGLLEEELRDCFSGDSAGAGGWYQFLRLVLIEAGFDHLLAHLVASGRGEFRDLFEGE